MPKVYRHAYTLRNKPDSNREPGQEVLVPYLVTLRSSRIVLTEQLNLPLQARQFALEYFLF